MQIRVIIAGSRSFSDYELLHDTCTQIFRELKKEGVLTKKSQIEIVSGRAQGADRLGEQFAKQYGLQIHSFPADWNQYGKRAGYLRNEQMAAYASEPDVYGMLVAFWDGKSRGTASMLELGNKKAIKLHVVKFNQTI